MKICFIISSVIAPSDSALSYSSIRSVFNNKERLNQTIETINSIKKYCPNSYILLIEASKSNKYSKELYQKVDKVIFIGDNSFVRRCIDSKFKIWGELALLYVGTRKINDQFDLIFKISGRYRLNDQFNINNHEKTKFNVKLYGKSISTRLYSLGGILLKKWRIGLLAAFFISLLNKSIEEVSYILTNKKLIHEIDVLGIEGLIGPNGSFLKE